MKKKMFVLNFFYEKKDDLSWTFLGKKKMICPELFYEKKMICPELSYWK